MDNVTNIHKLSLVEDGIEPVRAVVDLLEDLLQRAQSGDIQSLIVCGDEAGGNVITGRAGLASFSSLGALEYVRRETLDRLYE